MSARARCRCVARVRPQGVPRPVADPAGGVFFLAAFGLVIAGYWRRGALVHRHRRRRRGGAAACAHRRPGRPAGGAQQGHRLRHHGDGQRRRALHRLRPSTRWAPARLICPPGKLARRASFAYGGGMTGLRERKKLDTRRALSDAALQLAFEARPRHRDARSDRRPGGRVVADVQQLLHGQVRGAGLPPDRTPAAQHRPAAGATRRRAAVDVDHRRPCWNRSRTTCATAGGRREQDAEPQGTRRDPKAVDATGDPRRGVTRRLFDEWLEAIAERTGTDPARDMYPRLVAAVVRAVGDAATETYVASRPARCRSPPCCARRSPKSPQDCPSRPSRRGARNDRRNR